MDNPLCDGAPLPPLPNVPWFKIIWCTIGRPVRGILAADSWKGFWTHWLPLTVGCEQNDYCPFCMSGKPLLYVAYIPIWDVIAKKYAILQLPDGAARILGPVVKETGSLNGQEVTVRRNGKDHKSPVSVELVKRHPVKIKHPIDMDYSIQRVWGMNMQRHVDNMGNENARYTVTNKSPDRGTHMPGAQTVAFPEENQAR